MSILDIGAGFGRWGILFREFLEVWGSNNYSGDWERVIHGIEIFPDYIKPYHYFFYNNIFLEDALSFMKKTDCSYDLINCGDVIEHFDKKDAFELIDLCLQKSKYLLINIPIGNNWHQDSVNNNEYEKHRSSWEIADFRKYNNRIIKNFRDIELRKFSVILLSRNKIVLSKTYGKHFKTKSILKNKLKMEFLVDKIENRKLKSKSN